MGALEAKAVVVTGAGRGIGAAIARAVAAEGGSVVVNDVDLAAAEAVVEAIRREGGQAVADGADITSWSAAGGLVDRCVDELGGIDGLVNNAGLFAFGTPDEMTEAHWRRVVEVNLLGTAFCGSHAIRHMAQRGAGSIVNVTSGSHLGAPLQSVYAASKGGVASLTYSWAIDLADRGVRVNALSPMAATRMSDDLQDYFRRRDQPPWPPVTVPPERNAPVVTFLLSDDAAGVHGQIVRIDDTRLTFLTHPAVLHPPLEDSGWTHARVRDAFATELAARQVPLGLVATTGQFIPYRADHLPDDLQGAPAGGT